MAKDRRGKEKGGSHVDGKTLRRAASVPGWVIVETKRGATRRGTAKVEQGYVVDHHGNRDHHKEAGITNRAPMARQNRKHFIKAAEVSDSPAWVAKGKLAGHVGGYHNDPSNK